jgi:hypothetical protein
VVVPVYREDLRRFWTAFVTARCHAFVGVPLWTCRAVILPQLDEEILLGRRGVMGPGGPRPAREAV